MSLSLTIIVKDLDYSFYKNLSIFFVSFLSNTFSGISGGGAGLVQLPALILFGIPYYQALATHKFATVALGIGGSLRNLNTIKKDRHILFQILFFGTPGVVFGASVVDIISEEYFYLVLGLFSIFLALYSFYKPDFGLVSLKIKLNLYLRLRFAILIFLIGILNGSISSGTGLLVTMLIIKTFGLDFLRAVSITFLTVGILWNAVGAICLTKIGSVPSGILIILVIGSFLGGFFGAHLSNLKGNKLIKKTFTIICFLIGTSLLIKSFFIFI